MTRRDHDRIARPAARRLRRQRGAPTAAELRQFLDDAPRPFTWVDLEEHPELTAEVEARNDGKRIIPTIVFPDGSHPGRAVERRAGRSHRAHAHRRSAASTTWSSSGGGPTGLTTSIYGARENLKVLIIEKSAPGGQAGVTERFDNYPGFPDGVGGAELAERMTQQAAALRRRDPPGRRRDERSRATGHGARRPLDRRLRAARPRCSSPPARPTGAPTREGEADLIGAGIHFCATCDGPFYRGATELTVIGGGNSGLEEGLFLTQFAEHVTILQAQPALTANKLLQEKVLDHPRMSVRAQREV